MAAEISCILFILNLNKIWAHLNIGQALKDYVANVVNYKSSQPQFELLVLFALMVPPTALEILLDFHR